LADPEALKAVVRNTEGGEEGQLADQDVVLEAARARGVLESMSSCWVRQAPPAMFIDVTEKLASLLA
jgi:hypothetical protein